MRRRYYVIEVIDPHQYGMQPKELHVVCFKHLSGDNLIEATSYLKKNGVLNRDISAVIRINELDYTVAKKVFKKDIIEINHDIFLRIFGIFLFIIGMAFYGISVASPDNPLIIQIESGYRFLFLVGILSIMIPLINEDTMKMVKDNYHPYHWIAKIITIIITALSVPTILWLYKH